MKGEGEQDRGREEGRWSERDRNGGLILASGDTRTHTHRHTQTHADARRRTHKHHLALFSLEYSEV